MTHFIEYIIFEYHYILGIVKWFGKMFPDEFLSQKLCVFIVETGRTSLSILTSTDQSASVQLGPNEYIDAGNGCWRRIVLVMLVTNLIHVHKNSQPHLKSATIIKSPA